MHLSKSSALCILLLCSLSSLASANQYESTDNLIKIAKNFVVKTVPIETSESLQVSIEKSNISDKLALCGDPLRVDFPSGANRDKMNAVQISCDAPIAWQFIVPVNVGILTKVVVAKHNISSQQVIGEDDVDFSQNDRTQLYNGYFTQKDKVVGLMSNQPIVAGMVISKRNIQQPTIVHRNDVIDLTAKSNSITVTMKGIARSDGGLHDMIKAYNPSSKRLLDAVVVGQGRVEVVS